MCAGGGGETVRGARLSANSDFPPSQKLRRGRECPGYDSPYLVPSPSLPSSLLRYLSRVFSFPRRSATSPSWLEVSPSSRGARICLVTVARASRASRESSDDRPESVLRVLEGVEQPLVRARTQYTRDGRRRRREGEGKGQRHGERGSGEGGVNHVHAREPNNFPPYLSLGGYARVRSGFGLVRSNGSITVTILCIFLSAKFNNFF